jgi:hypothetical protein
MIIPLFIFVSALLLFVFRTIAATNAAKWLPTGLPPEPAPKKGSKGSGERLKTGF